MRNFYFISFLPFSNIVSAPPPDQIVFVRQFCRGCVSTAGGRGPGSKKPWFLGAWLFHVAFRCLQGLVWGVLTQDSGLEALGLPDWLLPC